MSVVSLRELDFSQVLERLPRCPYKKAVGLTLDRGLPSDMEDSCVFLHTGRWLACLTTAPEPSPSPLLTAA